MTCASNPQLRILHPCGRRHAWERGRGWGRFRIWCRSGNNGVFLWVFRADSSTRCLASLTRGERRSCHAPADWIIISLLSPLFFQGQSRPPITAPDQAISLSFSFTLSFFLCLLFCFSVCPMAEGQPSQWERINAIEK